MLEAALYHGFSEDSDNDDGVTDYRCSRAVLLKLMRACVKQGETNAKVNTHLDPVNPIWHGFTRHKGDDAFALPLTSGGWAVTNNRGEARFEPDTDLSNEPTWPKMASTVAAACTALNKLNLLLEPKSFEIKYGSSPSATLNQRITELHKEIGRVLDDKRKMYEPPTDAELSRCCEIFGPIKSVQTGPELQIAVRNVLKEIIAMRKCSTTYDNQPKSAPEKIAEPTVTEINNIREAVAESFNYNPDSKNMTKLLTEAITRFVELRNKD